MFRCAAGRERARGRDIRLARAVGGIAKKARGAHAARMFDCLLKFLFSVLF
ncbi:hypothetical protein BUH_3490 [Burkholderia pseudomallei Pakistan 9]|nr:hypothetical protein BUH_3490 [Burkholderia pseudomallei Pakistan 9]